MKEITALTRRKMSQGINVVTSEYSIMMSNIKPTETSEESNLN